MDNNFNNQEYAYVEAESNGNKGLAITLLVLGIVSCVLSIVCCCPGVFFLSYIFILVYILAEFIPFAFGVVGIILYLVKKNGFNSDTMKLARPGFICSIVGVAIIVLGLVVLVLATFVVDGLTTITALLD